MTLQRGMVITMLGRMAAVQEETVTASGFSDVSADANCAPYTAWGKTQGIVQGTENGLFLPARPITREEFSAVVFRYAQTQGITLPAPETGGFDPRGNATRAEACAIMRRLARLTEAYKYVAKQLMH